MSGAPVPVCPAGYQPYTLAQEKQFVEPIVIGMVISFCLFGIGLLQFYGCASRISISSTQDKITMWFLAVLFVADIVDSVGKGLFLTQYIQKVITGGVFGSVILPKSCFTVPITESFITVLNHLVYIYRIIRLTPRRGPITYIILISAGAVSIGQLVGALRTSFWCNQPLPQWVETGIMPWTILWMGGAAVADAILCIAFVVCLAKHRSDFANTNLIITKWIGLSLETGILPSVLQITTVAVYAKYPKQPYEIVFASFQPKIYVNAILVVVSSVISNRAGGHSGTTASGSFQQQSYVGGPSAYGGGTASGMGKRGQQSGMALSSMPRSNTSPGITSGIMVTSEVYRVPEHVDLRDQDMDPEKVAYDRSYERSPYSNQYR